MNYTNTPRTEAEKILAEAGVISETKIYSQMGRPGDVYESRVVAEVSAGNYTVLVYESGSIDTDHTLYLVNVAERICARIDSALHSTPGGYFGGIKIESVEEKFDGVLIKWTARRLAKEGKFTLTVKIETKQEVLPVLTKIS